MVLPTNIFESCITMLSAGIMKEVSVSCKLKSVICSVCGQDNIKSYCKHIGGRTYGDKQCHFILEDPEDAFEVSFVAVPAQKEAGVIKSYGDLFLIFGDFWQNVCRRAFFDLLKTLFHLVLVIK